jgi:7-cyano-7-deazaguanine synthase
MTFYFTSDRPLVVLSGGQDSTTCLYWAKTFATEVHAITFDYSQRHAPEIGAACRIAEMAGVASHEVIRLGPVLAGTSPLIDPDQHVETYADPESLPGGIEKTFVPMRNALFLTIAANRAVVLGCDSIIVGVSEEDFGGYPDCRGPFLAAMQTTINEAIGTAAKPPLICAPLLHRNKMRTVLLAQNLPGCMEALEWTHTCYRGEFPPCGSCHACLLRRRGFFDAMVDDPLYVRAARVQRGMERARDLARKGTANAAKVAGEQQE